MKKIFKEAIEESQLTKRWGTWLVLWLFNFIPYGIGSWITQGFMLEPFKKDASQIQFLPNLTIRSVFPLIWNTIRMWAYMTIMLFTYGLPFVGFLVYFSIYSPGLAQIVLILVFLSPFPIWFMFATNNAFRERSIKELFFIRKINGQFKKQGFTVYGYWILYFLLVLLLTLPRLSLFLSLFANSYDIKNVFQADLLFGFARTEVGRMTVMILGYSKSLFVILASVVFTYIFRKLYLSTLES